MRSHFWTAFLLIAAGGCTAPELSHRKGLFDDWDPAGKGRTYSKNAFNQGGVRRLKHVTKDWIWPLAYVEVNSKFGDRDSSFHEGVDLKAKTGTPIYSVSGGKVVYSGSKMSGYGKIIIIDHGSNIMTVYAHCSKIKVSKGAKVVKGQYIGLSGQTGRVSGPHLHFEIREGLAPLDPELLIAKNSIRRNFSRTIAGR